MHLSEAQIILDCQTGNMDSFVYLYDQYAVKIYQFHFYRTRHRELAEDLTSQTFIKAMDKIESFRNENNFQPWLYQIARNTLIDHYRKQKPSENIDDHFDIASEENIADAAEQQAKNEDLNRLLEQLPEDARELVKMRIWDELSYAEIAAITGRTEGGLKMQFSRVIAELRQQAHFLLLTLIFMRW